jgi:hypothetical protein
MVVRWGSRGPWNINVEEDLLNSVGDVRYWRASVRLLK